jgi:hypothetical protein
MPGVFISYRRLDSDRSAKQIDESLAARFGRDNVFLDVVIPPAAKFPFWIEERLKASSALLVVIGKQWLLHFRDASDPGDWVRREIEIAAANDIPIIPVLVDGATFPTAAELPESIRDKFLRNAVVIDDPVESAIDSLAEVLEPIGAPDTGPASVEAFALTGKITAPAPARIIDKQAVSGSGGKRYSLEADYRLNGIVSHNGARSEVDGRRCELDDVNHETTVTVSVDHLNVYGFLTADRIAIRLVCRHRREGGEPRISLEGSVIGNLRIAGNAIDVVRSPASRAETMPELQHIFRSDEAARDHLVRAGLRGARGQKIRLPRFGSALPTDNGLIDVGMFTTSSATYGFGTRLVWREFGEVIIGRVLFGRGRRKVTMLAVNMQTESVEGAIEVGCASIIAHE